MKELIENTLRKWIEPAQYKCLIIPQSHKRQRHVIRSIQENGHATVVFVVSSLAMWRYQGFYELLRQDQRFDVRLALFPFPTFEEGQKKKSIDELVEFCVTHQIPYLDLTGESNPGLVLKRQFPPDILFYQQPYNHLYLNDLDARFFKDSLLCYIPYCINTSFEKWVYRSYLCDTAWRLFLATEIEKKGASKILYSKGRNIRVTGDPIMDTLTSTAQTDVWKMQDKPKKRIIWAPHFSIVDSGMLHRNSFSWLGEFMPRIALQYRDRIQFAFKPHPRLLSELYAHPDWGKEKADAYYAWWREEANTQLVTGSYVDLFKTSDAMIHDCGSFSVEYQFTGKPVMFTTQDLEATLSTENEFGQQAILAHYIGRTNQDVVDFIDRVVLAGNDPDKERRTAFIDGHLRPKGGNSVAETIYQEILTGLGFNR